MQSPIEDSKRGRLIMLALLIGTMALLLALYFFVRPKVVHHQPVNNSGIEHFVFERLYPDGTEYRFSMKAAQGGAHVTVYDSTLGGKRECQLPPDALQTLQKTIAEHDIYRLDGYYERAPVIGRESSFSLRVAYADGRDIAASGVMQLPVQIDDATGVLKQYFYDLLIR